MRFGRGPRVFATTLAARRISSAARAAQGRSYRFVSGQSFLCRYRCPRWCLPIYRGDANSARLNITANPQGRRENPPDHIGPKQT